MVTRRCQVGRYIPKEVPHERLDNIPADEYIDVSVPGLISHLPRICSEKRNRSPDVTESKGTRKGVDETESVNNDTTESETFGSLGVLE